MGGVARDLLLPIEISRGLMDIVLRYSLILIAVALGGKLAHANDLKQLYELALTRDTTLQVAHFQRDAAIEERPQGLASLLPQVSASASAARERAGYDTSQISSRQTAACTMSADAGTQRCYGTVRGLGLNLSQTLWSYQAFDAVEASRRSVEFGTGKEFDLLNAQNNYYVAIRAYNQARYDYLTSVLTLKLEASRLTGRDLTAIDELLVEGSA